MNPKRAISLYLFILLASLYTLSASLRIDSGDGAAMYRVAESLTAGDGGAISVHPPAADTTIGPRGEVVPISALGGGDGYGKWGIDGRYYAKYGVGLSLVVSPVVSAAKLAAGCLPMVTEAYAGQAAMVWLNALVTAFTCVLLFQLLTQFYAIKLAGTLAILYGLGTIACYYAKSAFSEPLATLLLLLALCGLDRKRYWLSGTALGGMLLVRQPTIFLVAPILVWILIRIRRVGPRELVLRSLQLLLPVALGQLMVWAYNIYRFGDWMEYGYTNVPWNTPLLVGLYSLLLSPGKGLLVFAPILLTGVLGWLRFRQYRPWAVLTLALVVAWLVPHSLYAYWDGGGGWGPRLLMPIVPLLVIPAGKTFTLWRKYTLGRLALALLIVVSVLFQALGSSANWARHLQRVHDDSATLAEYYQRVHYSWPDSPILGQLISIQEQLALMSNTESRDMLQSLTTQAQISGSSEWQTEAVEVLSLNVPDYWFIYVLFLGILPSWGVSTLIILLFGIMAWSAYRLNRLLHILAGAGY